MSGWFYSTSCHQVLLRTFSLLCKRKITEHAVRNCKDVL
jgi:hypothetical protein